MLKKMYWDIAEHFAHKWFERLRIKSFKVAGLDFTTEVVYDENGKFECFVVDDEELCVEENKKYVPTYLYDVMFEVFYSEFKSEIHSSYVEAYSKEDAEYIVMEDLMLKGFDGYVLFIDECKNFMPYFNAPPLEDCGWK